MKKFLSLFSVLLISFSLSLASPKDKKDEAHKYKYGSDNPIENVSSNNSTSKVYICTGPNAYAYHLNRNCRGLNRCSCEIQHVARSEAARQDCKKPCRICAKGHPRLK